MLKNLFTKFMGLRLIDLFPKKIQKYIKQIDDFFDQTTNK